MAIRILHFEPDSDYGDDFLDAAKQLGGIEVVREPHGEEVPRIFSEGGFDAVVLEYEADLHNGLEVLLNLRAIKPDLNYVFLSYMTSRQLDAMFARHEIPYDRRIVKHVAGEDLLKVLEAFERQGLKPR